MAAEGRSTVTLTVAARLTGTTPARIRRYCELGLVAPARKQGESSWYGPNELVRIRKIRRLREHLGLNLASIEVILRLTEDIEELRSTLVSQAAMASGSHPRLDSSKG